MIKFILPTLLILIFNGCNDTTQHTNYDGKKLLEQKCSSCHNLDIPPKLSEDELAPPMMAVAFHVKNFVTPSDESQRTSRAIEFVVDYVQNPSLEKSFCDKESLKRYGLMPSQKENVNKDEIQAIAEYMFQYFTQENLDKKTKEQAKYNALPAGKKIALKYKCLGCHKVDKKIVGPSFADIAKRYSPQEIAQSIQNGSKAKWDDSHGAIMPAFKNISTQELKILSSWISS